MYDFIAIAKTVNDMMDGIFKAYHIEKLEIKETEYTVEVKTTIMNDWTKTRYTFIYEWNGSKLENISVTIEK